MKIPSTTAIVLFNEFTKELPMKYTVVLNRLMEMEGSVG
jgi:Fe-S cluster assembly scaffold protein SufB